MSTPERGLELDPKTWLDAKSADVMHPLESESKQGPDATTHAQVHRLPSEALLDTLKMILVGAPLNEVLTSVTRLIEANSEGMLCSILLLEKDDLHLRYAAAPNLPDSYRAATDRLAVGPSAGSCGTAAYLRRPVFVADILTDPKWVKFTDFAVAAGLRAAWSSPIISRDGKVLGTFGMYYRDVRHPDGAKCS